MIPVDQTYTDLRDDEANIEWQVLNGTNTFDASKLITGKLSTATMSKVSVGFCVSAQLDLELWGVTVNSSYPLILQFRAKADDGSYSSWYTKGTFFVDTLEKSPYTEETRITAYDAMMKAEVGYLSTDTWVPTTDEVVVEQIATDLGVDIDPATASAISASPIDLIKTPYIGTNGTTDRNMLSYIGIMRGGNWIINSANKLQLIYPSVAPVNTANVDLAVGNFGASETLTVTKVKVNVDSETSYRAPSNLTEDEWKELAGFALEVSLPIYGTQEIANSLLTQYENKTFIPYSAEGAYVDPKYEVGDAIRFQKDSNYYTTLIANQSLTIDPLCRSDLSLEGEEKLNSLYPYLPPREREVQYQIEELAQATTDATLKHFTFANATAISVADQARVKVMRLYFFMEKSSYLSIDMEFLLTVAATSSGSSISVIDPATGEVTVTATIPTTGVETEYWLDGSQITGHNPELTCIDGKHVLRVRWDTLTIGTGAHAFEVYFTADGGSVNIPIAGINAWIDGTGVGGEAPWDGTITVEDVYTPLTFDIVSLTETVSVAKQTPTAKTFSDTYSGLTFSLVTLDDEPELKLGIYVKPSAYVAAQTIPASSTVWQANANDQYVESVAVTGMTGFSSITGQGLHYMASFDGGTTWQGWDGSAWVNDLQMNYATISAITSWTGSVKIKAIFVNGQKAYGFMLEGATTA